MKREPLDQIVVGPLDVGVAFDPKGFADFYADLRLALNEPRRAQIAARVKRDYGRELKGDRARALILLCWDRCMAVRSKSLRQELPAATFAKIKSMQADANRALGAMAQVKALLRYFPENDPDSAELVAAVANVERIVKEHAQHWGTMALGYPPAAKRRGKPEHVFTPLIRELGGLLVAAGLDKTQASEHIWTLLSRSGLLRDYPTTPPSIRVLLSSRRSGDVF